jgi:hypothetical protein
MIEINLVPDVKRELLRAQKVRSTVISFAIIVGISALSIVLLLAFWVFIVQTARGVLSDNTIKSEDKKLQSIKDLPNALTIQNQLGQLVTLHNDKHITSRIFDVLATINPPEPNNIGINRATLNTEDSTITLEAQAASGYPALEVFRKTISATKFRYTDDSGQIKTVSLASELSDSERSYGEDAAGKKVLRFTLSFKYPQELLQRSSLSAIIIAPTKTNATDSFIGVPASLFTEKASDPVEDK